MNDITTSLHDEILSEFEVLSELEAGSDEYRATVDGLTKLMDRAIELERLKAEQNEKVVTREDEQRLREKERHDERRDQIIKNIINGASMVLPLLVTIWGTNKTLKFEETGTVTTMMGRGFINKLLPKGR